MTKKLGSHFPWLSQRWVVTVFSYRESFLPSAFFYFFNFLFQELPVRPFRNVNHPWFLSRAARFPRADSSVVFGAVTDVPLSVRTDVVFRRIDKRREITKKSLISRFIRIISRSADAKRRDLGLYSQLSK